MLVLLGYAIFVHSLSFSVLHIKHTVQKNSQGVCVPVLLSLLQGRG